MNLKEYQEKKKRLKEEEESELRRYLCVKCLRPHSVCYCSFVKKFDPKIKFVILIHPIEVKRKIATGRMSHLSLLNSDLVEGQNYTDDRRVNAVLSNPIYQPVLLYPGENSLNLSTARKEVVETLFPKSRIPAVFVIDGTWNTASRMIYQSQNLKMLPRISFNTPGLSKFKVRKQPKPEFLSTIEAIHHTIELLGPNIGFDTKTRTHDSLIDVFQKMVEMQLTFVEKSTGTRHEKKKERYLRRLALEESDE